MHVREARIRIEYKHAGRYRYALTTTHPETAAGTDAELALPYADEQLLRSLYRGEQDDIPLDRLAELSHRLYRLLFPGELAQVIEAVRDGTAAADHLRIVVESTDGEVLSLPWEFVTHAAGGRLALQGNVSLVRALGDIAPPEGQIQAPPLSVLVLLASPDGEERLDFNLEQDVLLEALEPLQRTGLVRLDFAEEGNTGALQRALMQRRYDVLHMWGHGNFQEGRRNGAPGVGYFAFEDEQYGVDAVTAPGLLSILRGSHCPKLVVLSGCLTSRTNHDALSGMAQALAAEIPAVIGFQFPMLVPLATAFGATFYDAMARGDRLDESLTQARQAMAQLVAGNEALAAMPLAQLGWAIPTLYRRSDEQHLVNFALEPEAAPARTHDFRARFGDIAALPTGFVGRRLALRECRAHLREKPCLYIHGYGGIGKSTLSTKLAEGYLRDGYGLVTFRGKVRVEEIIKEVADDLVLRNDLEGAATLNNSQVSPEQKLTYCVENVLARQRYLLIFDNFEDNQDDYYGFFDQALAEAFGKILRRIAGSATRVIMTSRYVTREAAIPETLMAAYNLGEMGLADVRIKMGREESLRAQSSEVLTSIHDRIGGHPKAIQDVAAVLENTPLTWEQVDERLRGVEDELQRSFLLLDILYEYLEPAEQELLRRASVYKRPAPIAAMQMQVAGDVERLLPSLISRSLVQVETSEDGVEVYLVHRVTTQFLAERHLCDEERTRGHAAAAEHYEHEASENAQGWWLLFTAREHHLAAGNLERAAEIASALTEPLRVRGYYDLVIRLNEETLANPPGEALRAAALHNVGVVHEEQGRLDEAMHHYEGSLGITRRLGDQGGVAMSLRQIGTVHQQQGRLDEAMRHYEEALDITRNLGDLSGIAGSLHQMGTIYQLQGHLDEAMRQYKEALDIARELGEQSGIATSGYQIAMIYQQLGRTDEAMHHYEESLAINRRLGDQSAIAHSLGQIGMIHQDLGSPDEAMRHYEMALEIKRRLGDQSGIAHSLGQIGTLVEKQGRVDDALRYVVRALLIFYELQSPQAQVAANHVRRLGETLGEAVLQRRLNEEQMKVEERGTFPVLDEDRQGVGGQLMDLHRVQRQATRSVKVRCPHCDKSFVLKFIVSDDATENEKARMEVVRACPHCKEEISYEVDARLEREAAYPRL